MITQATVERLPIAAESVDLIFTDPPYAREYLPLYGWLAQEAARVLKPGGFVAVMCGNTYLPEVFELFTLSELRYFFSCYSEANGNGAVVYRDQTHGGGYPVISKIKPILVYSKGRGRPRVGGMLNIFKQGTLGDSKLWHAWGQSVAEARYYIDHLSEPGGLVLDPCIGGGTTAVACELLGRRWLGLDIDGTALDATRKRVAGELIPVQGSLFAE